MLQYSLHVLAKCSSVWITTWFLQLYHLSEDRIRAAPVPQAWANITSLSEKEADGAHILCPVKTVVWSLCFPKQPFYKNWNTQPPPQLKCWAALSRIVGYAGYASFFSFAVFSSGVKSQWIVLVHIAGLLRDSEARIAPPNLGQS